MEIIDPRSGDAVRVNKDGRLFTRSFGEPLQHWVSHELESSYQATSNETPIAGETVGLYIENTDEEKDVIFTYIRQQVVSLANGAAPPAITTYSRVTLGAIVTTPGTVVPAINVFKGKTKKAPVIIYRGGVLNFDDAEEIDRYYFKFDGDEVIYNKEGSVIIGPGQTLAISLVSAHTAGIFYSRASFVSPPIDAKLQ